MLRKYAIDGALRFEPGLGGLTRAVIDCDTAQGEIYLHGAHITKWRPRGTDEVLFLSRKAVFTDGEPIRGGVPVCFPWFGPHPCDGDAPNHGPVRTRAWELIRTHQEDQAVTLELGTTVGSLDVTLAVTFGATLAIALTATHRGDEEQVITEALHTYLAVEDVRHIHVTGLKNITYHSKVENGRFTEQNDEIHFTRETDRVYLDTTDTCVLHDPQKQRKIIVEKFGSRSTVLWNPWETQAEKISDLGNDQWLEYVCIETANALDDAITLKPGASHTITTTLSVESM